MKITIESTPGDKIDDLVDAMGVIDACTSADAINIKFNDILIQHAKQKSYAKIMAEFWTQIATRK